MGAIVYYAEVVDIVPEADPVALRLRVLRLTPEAALRKNRLKREMREKQRVVERKLHRKEGMCEGFFFLPYAVMLTKKFKEEVTPLLAEYESICGEELEFFVPCDLYAEDDFPRIFTEIPEYFKTKDALRYKKLSDKAWENFMRGLARGE